MKKILLVEDDKSLSIALVYFLNKEGYLVTHTESINETLKKLSIDTFDIAILDITLPDGEGYDLVEDIRKNKNVPIIFLTAKDEESDILKGFDLGADDYITKPFSLKVLDARIKSIFNRIKDENNTIMQSGKIKVNRQALKVYKEDKIVDLTQSELKLLIFFMDNYNIALSRETILEFLWDSGAEFQAYSTISVYINRLREKIEDNIENPQYIVTKRGIGYMWAMEVI